MALHTVTALIRFADDSESFIEVRAKTAEYFGIREATPKMEKGQKKAYSYHRRKGLSSELGTRVEVPASRFTRVPRKSIKSVREVRVPTEFVTPRGNVRTYGIKFPTRADYVDISHWLYWNCTKNKPKYFVTEAGKKRGVFDQSEMSIEDGIEG